MRFFVPAQAESSSASTHQYPGRCQLAFCDQPIATCSSAPGGACPGPCLTRSRLCTRTHARTCYSRLTEPAYLQGLEASLAGTNALDVSQVLTGLAGMLCGPSSCADSLLKSQDPAHS